MPTPSTANPKIADPVCGRRIRNDNFIQRTRIDRLVSPRKFESGSFCNRGCCAAGRAVCSGGYTIRRTACRTTTPAYHQYRKGLDENVREQNVPDGLG